MSSFRFTVGLASSTHYLPWLRRLLPALNRAGAGGRLTRNAEWRCTVALIEAINNAIIHAHGRDSRRRIWLTCTTGGRSVRMTVRDEGRPFRFHRAAVPSPLRSHGRGLYLIRTLMTQVRYRRLGRGNCVELLCRDEG